MTAPSYKWRPDWVIRPGGTITETLKALGLTQTEVARQWGVSQPYVADIIAGRHRITAKIALRLEATSAVSAEFWMHLQTNYDLGLARGQKDVSDA